MTEMDLETVDIFLTGLRIARRRQLEVAGFPEKTAMSLSDMETLLRLEIAKSVSLEDAILARLEWAERPGSWLDWDLVTENAPAADFLLLPKVH